MDLLKIIQREKPLFVEDIENNKQAIDDCVRNSRFLVIGAAGTIGQAVTREIFRRNPKVLHAVDVSENNLVELVRNIRSSLGYISGEFKTFVIDCGSPIYTEFYEANQPYDYVLNLSALKHVRSEKDIFTLKRMIQVNVLNTIDTLSLANKHEAKKYFCVSTDKAANPVNLMGATKRLMEKFLFNTASDTLVSSARFPNVAFSDGSLLHSYNQRYLLQQPIPAPVDVRRYFVVPKEAGELCLLSCLLGKKHEIFFPKLSEELHMITFKEIAQTYLELKGYEPYPCQSEEEARSRSKELIAQKKWPCYFFESNTTGEKCFEEFYTNSEALDLDRFENLGIVKPSEQTVVDGHFHGELRHELLDMMGRKNLSKEDVLKFFHKAIGGFDHFETGKYLDSCM